MYPFERCIKVLKSYVYNRTRLEECIVEAQICKETVEFCLDFLFGLDPIGLGSLHSRERNKAIDHCQQEHTFEQAHLHVLQNIEVVHPYIK